MKLSDVNNPMKTGELSQQWTSMIMEEFWQQGDKESEMGAPMSMFMDRDTPQVPKCQCGFISFLVR